MLMLPEATWANPTEDIDAMASATKCCFVLNRVLVIYSAASTLKNHHANIGLNLQ